MHRPHNDARPILQKVHRALPPPSKVNNIEDDECLVHPSNAQNGDVDDATPLVHDLLVFPAFYKIPNLYLGIGDSGVDQFTLGIATTLMVDSYHNTNLICVHLETGISININSGFVHFLTPSNDKGHIVNIIDTQEHEPYGRASFCEAKN